MRGTCGLGRQFDVFTAAPIPAANGKEAYPGASDCLQQETNSLMSKSNRRGFGFRQGRQAEFAHQRRRNAE